MGKKLLPLLLALLLLLAACGGSPEPEDSPVPSASPSAQVYADDFLYDLKADPDELNNLVGNHAYDAVRDDLRAQLLDWIEQAEGYRPQIVDQA